MRSHSISSSALRAAYESHVAAGRFRSDPAQAAALTAFERLSQRLAAPPSSGGVLSLFKRAAPKAPKGLYLWGGVGRGKSMLMDLFYETCSIEPRRRVHFHGFMQEIHGAVRRERARGTRDPIGPVAAKVAAGARLLCFDEMQVTDITDAMILGRLFEALFAAGVAVVATSNRPPSDLYKDGLNRQLFLPFIAMLEDRMDVVALESGTDHRLNDLTRGGLYVTPLGRETTQRMTAIWRSLTGGAQTVEDTLTVHGRSLTVAAAPTTGGRAARAGFWDLCGQALGPADYLALAERYETLMLEGIPILSAAHANEAKRLVTLIDALYEARRRLAISAAGPPDRLYVEGSGAFEFERTVSRLIEMRSAAWLTQFPA